MLGFYDSRGSSFAPPPPPPHTPFLARPVIVAWLYMCRCLLLAAPLCLAAIHNGLGARG